MIIKESQLDAFREPARKEKRNLLAAELNSNGNIAIDVEDKITISRNNKKKFQLLYNKSNVLESLIKPSGTSYDFKFNRKDQLTEIYLPTGEFLKLNYKLDQLQSFEINKRTWQLHYDAKNRIKQLIHPDARVERFEYTKEGQLAYYVNRQGEVIGYDSVCENERLIHKIKDPLGRETSFFMDKIGDVEKIEFPDKLTQETTIDEDEGAEVIKLRNGSKRVTYYNDTKPTRVEWEDGNFVDFESNDFNLITSLSNAHSDIQYEYDEVNRLVSETTNKNQTKYIYNEDEQLEQMIYPNGMLVKYEYDEDENLKALVVNNQKVTFEHKNGTIEQINYPNGLQELQQNRLLEGVQRSTLKNENDRILSDYQYGYDDLFRLNRFSINGTNINEQDNRIEYDDAGRITSLIDSKNKTREEYNYDQKGNLIQFNSNKIKVGLLDQVQEYDGQYIQYDKNGNIIAFKNGTKQLKLKFADDNTLSELENGQEKWEYKYDGLGRRISKSNGFEKYDFVWSNNRLVSENYKASGKQIERNYIYTDSDIPFAIVEGDNIYWLRQDVRGAITEAYDNSGQLVWQANYTAFGKANIIVSKIIQPWRLAGQYYDIESGLHYSNARYYSSYLKSFLSVDSYWMEYCASNYGYAGNDPYNKIDGDGNWIVILVAAARVVAAVAVRAVASQAVRAAAARVAPIVINAVKIAAQGAVQGAANSIASDAANGDGICLSCIIKAASQGAKDAVLDPSNWMPGKKGPKPKAHKVKILPSQARKASDLKVNPKPPPAKPLNRPVGKSKTQNQQVQKDIKDARNQGATDFRVNQHQVNSKGERVGTNRPDLQYTDSSGKRVNIEYDTKKSTRGPDHEVRIKANDPDSKVILKQVD